MTADPPGRAPNPAVWAVQRAGRRIRYELGIPEYWDIYVGEHIDGHYAEDLVAWVPSAGAALAWLTDHRRRNPR